MRYGFLIYESPMILELPSVDAALEWAARCPAAATGAVEVRPIDAAAHETIIAP